MHSNYLNLRPIPQPGRSRPPALKNQRGFIRIALLAAVSALIIWAGASIVSLRTASADSAIPEIRSGLSNYCLDAKNGGFGTTGYVQAWTCNGTPAQAWNFSGSKIDHAGKYCLATEGSKVVIRACSASAAQNWSRDSVGIENTSNGQCLALPNGQTKLPLVTASCNYIDTLGENWTPDSWPGESLSSISSPQCNQPSLGDRVACLAEEQWLAWETEPKLHSVLLNDYTDGNSAEEWCADFVSYIYLQAGAPFTTGERGSGGWDEYNANYIIDTGEFTYHGANSGYVPRAGDVAFFDYPGGHVEIVESGGAHPTFVYGDSATIDPVTGNGDMAKNQIVNNGAGGVEYYLSPS